MSSACATLANLAMVVWLQQWLLKRVSAAEYSLYPVFASIMTLLPLLSMVFTAGIGRYVVDAYASQNKGRVQAVVSTIVPCLFGVAILVAVFGTIAIMGLGHILDIGPEYLGQARVMMGCVLGAFVVRILLMPFGLGPYVQQRFVVLNVLRVVATLLKITLLLVLLLGVGPRVMWIVVASSTASVTEQVAILLISRRLMPSLRFRFSAINWSLLPELLSFGTWSLVGNLGDMIRQGADPIILKKLATSVDVNCFYLGFLVLRVIQTLAGPLILQMEPLLTSLNAQGQHDRVRNVYIRVGRYAVWASMMMVLPLVVYRDTLFRLYLGNTYEQYKVATVVMGMLLLTLPIGYGHVLVSRVAAAKAQIGLQARRVIAWQGFNLVLTLVLVGVFNLGAIGSATGTLVSAALMQPLLIWPLGLRLAGLTFRQWSAGVVRPLFYPLVFGLVVLLAGRFYIQPDSWLGLASCAAAGIVAYMAAIVLLGMEAYERAELRRLLRSLWCKLKKVAG
jgi:O-antigen/teichoic acid export membrane protein